MIFEALCEFGANLLIALFGTIELFQLPTDMIYTLANI